ncbi:MAG: hypothetical protein AB7E12_03190 [Burkholderiaceae bacterium]
MVSMIEKHQEQDGKGVTVMFGRRSALRTSLPNNSILIVPDGDKWNDFSFRTRVDIRIRLTENEDEYNAHGFIGFITNSSDESNGVTHLEKLLEG